MHSKILLCTLFIVICVTIFANCQVHFQEEDTDNKHKPNSHMRNPVTSSKCKEGELLYPGDNNGDWACDCRPTFLYYPPGQRCYEAFSQGPCESNKVLILPKSKFVPVCEKNNCQGGKVQISNTCGKIGSNEGCKQPANNPKAFVLIVNATTLQLNCIYATGTRVAEPINEEEGTYEDNKCFPGGKRSQENLC